MNPRQAWLRVLFLLVLVPSLFLGASFPTDDSGRPAPWCSYLDDSVTPSISVICSVTRPLPAGNSGITSVATDTLGYGRTFFLAPSASQPGGANILSAALFVDEVNVVGYSFGAGNLLPSGSLNVATSNDGGRTWNGKTNLGCPSAGGCQSVLGKVVRTVASTPTYIIPSVHVALAGSIARSTSPTGGFTETVIAGLTANDMDVAVQGATVMVYGSTAGGAAVCRSDDAGATFQPCVLVGAVGSRASIAAVSLNVWIVSDSTGRIFRSTNNGATWTQVAAAGSFGELACLSSTVCLSSGAALLRSTDGGATWASPGGAPGTQGGSGGRFCNYGGNVVDFLQANTPAAVDNWPSTSTQTTTPAFRSTDAGISWVQVPVTGGVGGFGANPQLGTCAPNTTGRAVFTVHDNANSVLGFYYGPTSANTVQIVGANGIPLSVDANGNFTGNQGLPQATSPNAWGVVPVQGPALKNSSTTGAANTAVTVTIAAVASQRVHLRSVDADCSAAPTGAPVLTVTDGATLIWTSSGQVFAANLFTRNWQPSLDSTTGNALTVTLGACGVGLTGTLNIQADQF